MSGKFEDPDWTARGERRASVGFGGLSTLWLNTGTLCNLGCENCYIESSPRNDLLSYLTADEAGRYLDEAAGSEPGLREIGLTGGEPFMNPEIEALIEEPLARGWRVLVLTNAMRPMMRHADALVRIHEAHPGRLTLRVSLDHHEAFLHDRERGEGSFATTLEGLDWLGGTGIKVHVAGRAGFGAQDEREMRAGYARLFERRGIAVDASDPVALVLFPEMDEHAEVPEISEACWGILGRSPSEPMCASSRMVVKRRGAAHPVVVACTLLPYDARFELGRTLAEAGGAVALNHPHCARFCVLGGASCSATPAPGSG